jgi:DNA polymerase IV
MMDQELADKEAYFKEQALLDLSDHEQDLRDEASSNLERALQNSKAMPPPPLSGQMSSFLGPTPRERQAEFEAHTRRQRATERLSANKLVRSSTAPESELTKIFPITKLRSGLAAAADGEKGKLKRVSSLPEIAGKELIPFYKQVGVVPRELKSGKSVKPAENIKLEPEHKQLLKDKIVYFYPNDDISMARRTRIHKVIQLGAAWVNRWRDDVTHIMLDDANYTYSQLLRHLNRSGFPVSGLSCQFRSHANNSKEECSIGQV